MFSYQKINNIVGWLVFLIAAGVYIATVEPTASYWDCGEFIAVSRNLMTPHPPGAPLFLLIGRIFSLFAPTDADVALYINMVSVISSAFTILFLFWSITLISRKLLGINYKDEPEKGKTIAIMGAGIVGALAYTFSDSFWFSAVEAEVYALSSFFTAIVVWLILKWEVIADDKGSDRYLILIAYMVGLSIGVHLLNLLTIPAIAFVYYFRKYKPTTAGAIVAFLISCVVVILIQEGVIVMLPTLAGKFELLFVNSWGMSFNTGSMFFVFLAVTIVVYWVYVSVKTAGKEVSLGFTKFSNKSGWLNTAMLSLVFIIIGYSSYALIIIRSNQNPTIDENNPENVMSFVSYLKREQYGDRPLLTGPQFTAEVKRDKIGYPVYDGTPVYTKGDKKYEVYDFKKTYQYEPTVFLPRMHSQQDRHVRVYKSLLRDYGGWREGQAPNSRHNIQYLFSRQMGWMYFRYFLWNFMGREGDVYDSGWMTPFEEKEVPEILESDARNQYYALPLLLGILGLVFQFMKDKRSFIVVASLFFFTGIAIILWLNAPPIEPRERDYAYAGSYYAFCFFIGFGVLALYDAMNFIKSNVGKAVIATVISLAIPTIMAAENWDDHDRSGRYHSLDSAINLLNSCAENAILFTGGDNDTFPLWYAQEVEGIRRDVRVCNLSLLNTDWYIDCMRRDAYESKALPIGFEPEQYVQGVNDYIQNVERFDPKKTPETSRNIMNLDTYLKLVKKRDSRVVVENFNKQFQFKSYQTTLPTSKFVLKTDSATIAGLDFIPERYKRNISNEIIWNTGNNKAIMKKDLMILEMINNISKDGWKRPIYFSTTLGRDNLGLQKHFVLEGMAYRFLPVRVGSGQINEDVMYDNMMNKFQWRGLDDPTISYNEFYYRFTTNERNQFLTLANAYLNKRDKEKAKEVYDYSRKVMPVEVIPYKADVTGILNTATFLYRLEGEESMVEFYKEHAENFHDVLQYAREKDDKSMEKEYEDMISYLATQLENRFHSTKVLDEVWKFYPRGTKLYVNQIRQEGNLPIYQ